MGLVAKAEPAPCVPLQVGEAAAADDRRHLHSRRQRAEAARTSLAAAAPASAFPDPRERLAAESAPCGAVSVPSGQGPSEHENAAARAKSALCC